MNGNWNTAHNSSYPYSRRVQPGSGAKNDQGAEGKEESHRRSPPKTGLFSLAKKGLKGVNNSVSTLGKTMLWSKNGQLWGVKDDVSAEQLAMNCLQILI